MLTLLILMTVDYSLTTGEPLLQSPGLPKASKVQPIRGAMATHSLTVFGNITIQEIDTPFFSIRFHHANIKKQTAILCNYNYQKGILYRASLELPMHLYIKGLGTFHLTKNRFATIGGNKWMELIIPEKTGDLQFVDIFWKEEFLLGKLKPIEEIGGLINNIIAGVPDRITGPTHPLNLSMQRIIMELQQVDYSASSSQNFINDKLEKLFGLMLDETKNKNGLKKEIGEANWSAIIQATNILEANPDKKITVPEICEQIIMSENRFNKYFQLVTGHHFDVYPKYQRFTGVVKNMVGSDLPVSSFYKDAGYASNPSFVTGTRRLVFCTPGELKEDEWDLSSLPESVRHKHKNVLHDA